MLQRCVRIVFQSFVLGQLPYPQTVEHIERRVDIAAVDRTVRLGTGLEFEQGTRHGDQRGVTGVVERGLVDDVVVGVQSCLLRGFEGDRVDLPQQDVLVDEHFRPHVLRGGNGIQIGTRGRVAYGRRRIGRQKDRVVGCQRRVLLRQFRRTEQQRAAVADTECLMQFGNLDGGIDVHQQD